MDSDNNASNKITWKRSVKTDDTSDTSPPTDNTSDVPAIDISTRAASRKNIQPEVSSSTDIDSEITSLKDEIDQVLSGGGIIPENSSSDILNTRNDMVVDLDASDKDIISGTQNLAASDDLPRTTKANPAVTDSFIKTPQDDSPLVNDLPRTTKSNPIEINKVDTDIPGLSVTDQSAVSQDSDTSVLDNVAQDNHAALVASLSKDIQSDLAIDTEVEKTNVPKNTGVGQTYYSDLTQAMGSNEPATMSELIRKSRFEEKESKILSPKSKRNIAFIGGSILLLLVSIGILFSIFRPKETVQFITEERIPSMVYSNLDTGINTTGLESTRIKQAIRDVIETNIPDDSINQIYYVEEDGLGNVRRLGVKNIFEKTDNETPEILYDNIENDFTHAVYGTDKNYPFIMLKALSYDRALQGLKEWEPTMIDDLATYMDLPPEATDRSLLQPGFEDDLIQNKTVRVARFLPREVDQRGILDFLNLNRNNNTPETTEENNTTTFFDETEVQESEITATEPVTFLEQAQKIAQDLFGTPVYAQLNTNQINDSWNTTNTNSDAVNRVCYNDSFPGQIFDETFEGQAGYFCIDTLGTNNTIETTITFTDRACFSSVNGQRVPSDTPSAFCFESYRCYRRSCFVGANDVGINGNQPGRVCRDVREEGPIYHETDIRNTSDINVPKSCQQFNDIASLQNISSALLCFDANGRYLPNSTRESEEVSCIAPIQRQSQICVDRNNNVVLPSFPGERICFEPMNPGALSTTNQGTAGTDAQCRDLNPLVVRQRLAAAAFQLRYMAGLANLVGVSSGDVENMLDAARFLEGVAYGNILEVDAIRIGAAILQDLETVLDIIDPNLQIPQIGQSGGINVYGYIRGIIDTVKCVLGISNSLQWITLDQIPQRMTIFAGQSLPGMTPIQQALVLLGLMDPLSVTGTFDLITQDAISQFQLANGLEVTGVIDTETLAMLAAIVDGNGSLFGEGSVAGDGIVDGDGSLGNNTAITGDGAIINDYFIVTNSAVSSSGEQILTRGAYNESVESLQVFLYAEGYEISTINGLFDSETCSALQEFQDDQGLEVSDSYTCVPGSETLETINEVILDNNYLGSGFMLNPQGFLSGTGTLEGTFGPGIVDFEVNQADADSLREGDVVLMYMFLDEETILIARDQIVIEEVVKRRALADIFE